VEYREFKDHAARAALAACLTVATLRVAAADLDTGVEAEVRHAGNVGYAHAAADQIGDTSIGAKLSVARLCSFAGGMSAALSGDLRGEWFDHVDALRNATLEVGASARKKWGLGALAPWLRGGIALGRTQFDDRLRSATHYRAFVSAGRRLDARLNLWAEYDYEQRRAAHQPEDDELPGVATDVFTQRTHALSANLEYVASERIFLGLGALVRRGDVASTARPSAAVYLSARAVVEDPAFGPEFYAYKVTGTSYGLRLDAHFALGSHQLLGVAVQRIETRAPAGLDYADTVPQLNWSYRF
jgi:hypothetical protein